MERKKQPSRPAPAKRSSSVPVSAEDHAYGALTQGVKHHPEDMESMLVFRISAVWLTLPARYIVQLHPPPKLSPVPLAPGYVMGIANLRGEVVPVIDIGTLLDIEGTRKKRSTTFERVAVLSAFGMKIGMYCHEVREIVPMAKVERSELKIARGKKLERVAMAEVTTGDGVLIALDVARLLEEAKVRL